MEKIRMAILGAGKIAATMARTIQAMEQVELYAIASRDYDKAKTFADAYGFANAYGSYEELVQDDQVELIYVATPHSHHYAHVKMCLNHGRPVLCEKAFTANAKQAEELISLAHEKHVFLMEAMWVRFMPFYKTFMRILKGGALGKISSLTANLGYMIKDVERIVRPELAGGALLDLGVYVLTFAAMVFGSDVVEIRSQAVMLETGVDAQNSITLQYRDGKIAQLYSTALARTDRRGIIYGEKGWMEIENINNFQRLTLYDAKGNVCMTEDAPEQISGYEYQVLECIHVIREGSIESPEMPHSETLRIMQQMDEIRDSWGMKYPFE